MAISPRIKILFGEIKESGDLAKLQTDLEDSIKSQLVGALDRDTAYELALRLRASSAFFYQLNEKFSN